MEPLSLLLILMTFLECLLIALLVYSLLSLEIFNKRFFVLIIILTIFTSLIRVLPVIPLVIVFFAIVIYTVYIRYIYKVSVVITIIVSGLSYIIYRLMEGATVFALVKIFRISYKEIVNNPSIRVLFFAIFLVFISLIVYVIRYFNINLIDVIDILGFEDLKYLAEDEVDLSREKRVTSTIYLVIIFLLIQGLFINYNIWLSLSLVIFIRQFYISTTR